ncbi:type II toxin-antitoxin system death-on-curing family toxin [Arachidicoccus ginsenosidivorans]|jgi:death-on-curing protein|uniref:Type II toxin-antitoxin system death-on-curing family toxin n=1 Tax=Arachidicoccus ginsenosidivorans TaxID=496057 RepID=A0A5B8VP69_9BACT|nr:type II toxin-antitoxin system death-on-curing family toxin [Arachidicoccus ginsenosidivorans]QEC72405.1 type II toxin-antitoxin system death-on-curing family toxin [Arachidicoccus ginsenosidivorans]
MIYISSAQIISTHDKVLNISGGRPGVKNIEYLESVVQNIQIDHYYPEIESKLTHLVFSINKFHAFIDGNKRTSIAAGALFLEYNGFDGLVSKFIREMENIAVCVAENFIDKEVLEEIIYSILFESDYSEELKMKIIMAQGKMDDIASNLDDIY